MSCRCGRGLYVKSAYGSEDLMVAFSALNGLLDEGALAANLVRTGFKFKLKTK